MRLHSNAKRCPSGRLLLCRRVLEEGWTVRQAADAVGISQRRASVYLARYRREGEAGLLDRPAAPRSIPRRTGEDRVQAIAALRRLRMSGPEIAEVLSMPRSTVSAILARASCCISTSRSWPGSITLATVSPAAAGARRPASHFASYGIRVERVMTDNGPAYRSAVHALACRALRIRHLRTRPYRPRTNGKAERFIRTMLAGWAYGAIYGGSEERQRALPGWLAFYNRQRPHGSLGRQAPIERLLTLMNNVPGTYS